MRRIIFLASVPLLILTSVLIGIALILAETLPNGGQISFVSGHNGNADIYLLDIDRHLLINLTNHPADDIDPSWSPDGQQLVFASDRDGIIQLYVMDSDGRNLRRISNRVQDSRSPRWSPESRSPRSSPDGQQILYIARYEVSWGLHMMNADGSNSQSIGNLSQTQSDVAPSWSPDGDSIIFASNRSGNTNIYIMDMNDGDVREFAGGTGADTTPVWSPDGSMIAFVTYRGTSWDIYLIDSDGSNLRPFANGQDTEFSPTWSHDMRYFAYISQNPTIGTDLYLMRWGDDMPERYPNLAVTEINSLAWRP